jgi:hypothetical protein
VRGTCNFAIEVMGIRTQQRYPDFPKAVRAWSEDPDHSEVVELGWPDRKTGEQRVLRRYSREECLGQTRKDPYFDRF